MNKARFLYHTPKGEWLRVGGLIVGWTWLLGLFYNWKVLKYDYSHEEAWIPDDDGNFMVGGIYVGQCISSTTRGTANGFRFAPANKIIGKHPERWEFIEVKVEKKYYWKGIADARKFIGSLYDYGFIIGFVQPINLQDKNKWVCSEFCDWLKFVWKLIKKRNKRISPRRSAYSLAKVWGEPRPVKS